MLIKSSNLLSCKEPYEQELASLEKILSDYGYTLSVRAEELSLEVFVSLSNALYR